MTESKVDNGNKVMSNSGMFTKPEDMETLLILAKRRGLSSEGDYTTMAALNNTVFKGESSISAIFNHDLTLYSQFIGTFVVRNENDMSTWIDTNGKLHERNDLEELGKVTAETPKVAEIMKAEGITWGIDFSHQSVMRMESTLTQEGIETAEMVTGKPWVELEQEIASKTEIFKNAINDFERLVHNRRRPFELPYASIFENLTP